MTPTIAMPGVVDRLTRTLPIFSKRLYTSRCKRKLIRKGDRKMSEGITEVKVGQQVPDFELTVYEPENHGFGKRNLADIKKEGKWTILFFYPADFTFV
jgi:hypothetical protein